MAGTVLVLAITLVIVTLSGIAAFVATVFLAKRFGLRLKRISISPVHGYTAEFFDPLDLEGPKSGNNT